MVIFPARFFSQQQRLVCAGPFLAALQLGGLSYFLSGQSSDAAMFAGLALLLSYVWMIVAFTITGNRARRGNFTFLEIDLARRQRSREEDRWRKSILWLSGLVILIVFAKLSSVYGVPQDSPTAVIVMWAVRLGVAALGWAAVVVDLALVVWIASGFRFVVI